MKFLLLLLSFSIFHVLPSVVAGGKASDASSSYDPTQDMRNYTSDGWYCGDDYQDELRKLATEVDESLFPQFAKCDSILQDCDKCKHLQETRTASYNAFRDTQQHVAKNAAKFRSAAMKSFGL